MIAGVWVGPDALAASDCYHPTSTTATTLHYYCDHPTTTTATILQLLLLSCRLPSLPPGRSRRAGGAEAHEVSKLGNGDETVAVGVERVPCLLQLLLGKFGWRAGESKGRRGARGGGVVEGERRRVARGGKTEREGRRFLFCIQSAYKNPANLPNQAYNCENERLE